jgi:hypothetical protein
VVVDRRALAGQPHERDDRQPAIRRDVQDVLAVVVGIGDAVLRGEPVVLGEQRGQAPADRVGVVDEAVDVGAEVVEDGSVHIPVDARARAPFLCGCSQS